MGAQVRVSPGTGCGPQRRRVPHDPDGYTVNVFVGGGQLNLCYDDKIKPTVLTKSPCIINNKIKPTVGRRLEKKHKMHPTLAFNQLVQTLAWTSGLDWYSANTTTSASARYLLVNISITLSTY